VRELDHRVEGRAVERVGSLGGGEGEREKTVMRVRGWMQRTKRETSEKNLEYETSVC
jgi:hypothetical protein